MNRYKPLWEHIQKQEQKNLTMTFEEIENIVGFSLDHSFLTYKKELIKYGYQVEKISMEEKKIIFKRSDI